MHIHNGCILVSIYFSALFPESIVFLLVMYDSAQNVPVLFDIAV